MWPLKLDMTKEECRGVLRRLGEKTAKKKKRTKFSHESEAQPKQKFKNLKTVFNFRIGHLFECHEHLSCTRQLGQ